jgi:hypothetical protein
MRVFIFSSQSRISRTTDVSCLSGGQRAARKKSSFIDSSRRSLICYFYVADSKPRLGADRSFFPTRKF